MGDCLEHLCDPSATSQDLSLDHSFHSLSENSHVKASDTFLFLPEQLGPGLFERSCASCRCPSGKSLKYAAQEQLRARKRNCAPAQSRLCVSSCPPAAPRRLVFGGIIFIVPAIANPRAVAACLRADDGCHCADDSQAGDNEGVV